MSPTKSAPRGGIDLGGTKIQAAVVESGTTNVLGQARRPTPTTGGPEAVAAEMIGAMHDSIHDAGLEDGALVGVGVGSPGDVDEKTGAVSRARNLPDWEGTFELGSVLAEEFDTKVRVGNDVGVATEAEAKLGAGVPYDSLIGVFWGTGVGGGVVLHGEHWLGRGGAGEVGHVVVKMGGRRCPCGRRGCMEAYAGRSAMEARARKLQNKGRKTDLFKIMKKHDRDRLTSGIWERALKAKDPLTVELIDEAVEALGAGIASVVNLLDVEAVIIGGGIGVRLGEPYAKRITKKMHKHLFNADRPPDVMVAALGDFGGAIGAALLSAEGDQKPRRRRTTAA
ncbi:MAG TPA: ROK family protein [Acidimicrobiia bacterium]|jgi:glucokinase|nr:ROK family protein [Acidimicrobiia bacterium]